MLSRALTLLDCFVDGDEELAPAELARRGGLSKATAYRLAKELCDWSYLERAETGLRLGRRLFELGSQVRPYATLRQVGQPILSELSSSTRRCAHLAVLQDGNVFYVDKVGPIRDHLQLPTRPGGRMPAHCTALGKALLAHSPAESVRSVLNRELPRRTPRTVVAPGLLERELHAARRRGAAFDCEEAVTGIMCAATAFRTDSEDGWAAISISGRAGSTNELYRMARAVQRYAGQFGQAMLAAS